MANKFRKYIATDTVTSIGRKCFKRLDKGQINPKAGLYDDNDALLASWDELIYTYKMEYSSDGSAREGSAAYIFSHYSELDSGTKLIIDNSLGEDAFFIDGIFWGCTTLKTVEISNGEKRIYDMMFSGCTNLANITIPDSVNRIGASAFDSCKSLKHINIPNSVTIISSWAFSSSGITDITIPESIKTINMYTFANCTSLKSITIPTSITSIGSSAFKKCSTLTDVYYRGTEEQWNAITIDEFQNEYLTNATIHYNYTG